MAHPDMKEVMEMMYVTILKNYEGQEKDPKGKLLHALPSFVWHFDSIFEFTQKVGWLLSVVVNCCVLLILYHVYIRSLHS